MHVDEVFALRPELSNLTSKQFPQNRLEKTREAVKKRLGDDI
jgi:hypothetical protein